jgi:hypothetical protein
LPQHCGKKSRGTIIAVKVTPWWLCLQEVLPLWSGDWHCEVEISVMKLRLVEETPWLLHPRTNNIVINSSHNFQAAFAVPLTFKRRGLTGIGY